MLGLTMLFFECLQFSTQNNFFKKKLKIKKSITNLQEIEVKETNKQSIPQNAIRKIFILGNSKRQMTNSGARKILPFDISSDYKVFALK